ncbi:MAG: phage holin family protein [Blastocatellia bacterium]
MQSRTKLERIRSESGQRESFAELLVELAGQSTTLVREEVSLARQELRENIKQVRPPLLILALGAAGAAFSALALLAAVILALSQYWEPWLAALVVGIGMAVLAGAMIGIGLGQMKQARLKPEQTLATLEENKEWLKEIT